MRKTRMSLAMLVLRPVMVILLFAGVFGLVYLRSNVTKLEYSLGELEKKKVHCLRDRKMLFAEKTSQLSFARLESSADDRDGFVLPDRLQVVHVSKDTRSLPRLASLKQKQ
ncbi:MAG: hypothetical protein AMK74_03075 [Nitrospira bacterium SM23_35]|nr:MAG: hypothetical protein AMK74_03075 [Nitrospira bacterium SM23_35]